MVHGSDNSEKFYGLKPVDMMTLDGPTCDERFYLDNTWKPQAASPAPSSSSSVGSSEVTADAEQTWRRTSSASDTTAYEENSSSMWTAPAMQANNGAYGGAPGYPNMSSFPSPGSDGGAGWKEKPIEQWSVEDVTLWICSLMHNQSQTSYAQNINVFPYLNLRGVDLLHMSSTDIQTMDPDSGGFVFMNLQNLMNRVGSPTPYSHTQSPTQSPYSPNSNSANEQMEQNVKVIKEEPRPILDGLHSITENMPSFDPNETFPGILSMSSLWQQGGNLQSLHGTILPPKPEQITPPSTPIKPAAAPGFVQPTPYQQHPMMHPPPHMFPGWAQYPMPPFIPAHSDGFYPPGTGGNHLWEFIRDLLFDSRYNPSLIKWEDREEGIFKFVKSDQVAKLWGKKKNNNAMTYEKLSRAMRYYYRRKILERIDGRRLVYKFGSMATGWKA